jgi:hypothetical protein
MIISFYFTYKSLMNLLQATDQRAAADRHSEKIAPGVYVEIDTSAPGVQIITSADNREEIPLKLSIDRATLEQFADGYDAII